MSKYIEKVENGVYPVIPLRGLVIFPGIPTSFEINNKKSIKALLAAASYENTVFLSALEENEEAGTVTLATTGVTARIKQSIKLPDGNYRVLIEGKSRAEYTEIIEGDEFLRARVLIKNVLVTENGGIKGEALRREAIAAFENHIKLLPKMSPEIVASVGAITDPGVLADFIASNVLFDYRDKQRVLEEIDPFRRLETLVELLGSESKILEFKNELHAKVRERLEDNQRKYFLKEQMKVIRKELCTAVLCGVTLAAACFCKIMLVDHLMMGQAEVTALVAAVVCMALGITVVMAKMVGCTLPILAKTLNFDPAVMASLFITTIVDVLSLLAFFTLAKVILKI